MNAGELSASEAMEAAIEGGLAHRVTGPGPPWSLREVWVIEPDRYDALVPEPLLLVGFEDGPSRS